MDGVKGAERKEDFTTRLGEVEILVSRLLNLIHHFVALKHFFFDNRGLLLQGFQRVNHLLVVKNAACGMVEGLQKRVFQRS